MSSITATAPEPATLRFTLPSASHVTIQVMDVQGRHVRTLDEGEYAPGPYEVTWDLADDRKRAVPRGIYLLKVWAGLHRSPARLVVVGG
jgi:flagellar hook assembly protein FlgD